MFDKFKGLVVEREDLDELVALHAFGNQLKSSYTNFAMEVPEWVEDKLLSLTGEIKSRRKDFLMKEAKKIELSLMGLKTKEERKQELQEKLSRIQAQLS